MWLLMNFSMVHKYSYVPLRQAIFNHSIAVRAGADFMDRLAMGMNMASDLPLGTKNSPFFFIIKKKDPTGELLVREPLKVVYNAITSYLKHYF